MTTLCLFFFVIGRVLTRLDSFYTFLFFLYINYNILILYYCILIIIIPIFKGAPVAQTKIIRI